MKTFEEIKENGEISKSELIEMFPHYKSRINLLSSEILTAYCIEKDEFFNNYPEDCIGYRQKLTLFIPNNDNDTQKVLVCRNCDIKITKEEIYFLDNVTDFDINYVGDFFATHCNVELFSIIDGEIKSKTDYPEFATHFLDELIIKGSNFPTHPIKRRYRLYGFELEFEWYGNDKIDIRVNSKKVLD